MPVQAKLTLGRVDDPLELEADRVAGQVMRMPAPRMPSAAAGLPISAASGFRASAETLRREPSRENPAESAESGSVREALRSPGQPLAASARAFLEPRFGRDFSHVRVHTDGAAARSANDLDASAYTVGQNIVFAAGRYVPQSPDGQHLLAHELTHLVQQRGGGQQLIQRTPASQRAATESDDEVAVSRIENEDGTWTALNARGEVLYTGPLGLVVDPNLPNLYSTLVVGEREKTEEEKAAALRQYRDPAWDDPLSPIGPPESYDPKIYDPAVLARKAAERKFDEYDRKEYGANGVIYKRAGSGRVYANDIAPADWKELSERYNINTSTDPDRVVLPTGSYAFESVYEGKLLKQIMEENNLPPAAIHRVAARLEAEIESGAYQSLAGIGTARFSGQFRSVPRPPRPPRIPRKAPGPLGRAYLKVRLAVGLGGQGMDRAGANPTIAAGRVPARPVPALTQPATVGAKITPPASVVSARPATVQQPPPPPASAVTAPPAIATPTAPAAMPAGTLPRRSPPGGGPWGTTTSTPKTVNAAKYASPLVTVLPRSSDPWPGGYSVDPSTPAPSSTKRARADTRPFLDAQLAKVSNPSHPLHQALVVKVTALDGSETYTWRTTTFTTKKGVEVTGRYDASEHGITVQVGHATAFASGAPETFMLEDADPNQLSGQMIESKGAYSAKWIAVVDGVPVDLGSLLQWERLGEVAPGTAERATKIFVMASQ